ncbi:MAG: RsmE family RNA methyltransferase [Bacteroidota bacterium]
MEYFYTPPDRIGPRELLIEGEEFAHLTHVMRHRAGDLLRVADGRGRTCEVRIHEIRQREARCVILRTFHMLHESSRSVTVAAGILKNSSRYDTLVEKCTETGVHAFIPLRSARTIPSHAKAERWRMIALAAMKQSGRCVLPEVFPLTGLDELLEAVPPARRRIILHQGTAAPLEKGEDAESVLILVGPEGGFTEEELHRAEAAGFCSAGLGPRRLRTETAAIVSSALLLTAG